MWERMWGQFISVRCRPQLSAVCIARYDRGYVRRTTIHR